MTVATFEPSGSLSDYDSPPLDVAVTEEASTWVIDVRGELDLSTGPMLKQHLDPYSMGANHHKIVFSLPELEFIDASGLRALLTAVKGKTITLRNPSSQVRRLLEIVGMDLDD